MEHEHHRVERRRERRATLEAPLLLRRLGTPPSQSFEERVTKNISLAGVYFELEGEDLYGVNEPLLTSVSIPEAKQREFPFTRVAGRGRVVRVEELPPEGAGPRRRVGVAIEFSSDVTMLTAIPLRG